MRQRHGLPVWGPTTPQEDPIGTAHPAVQTKTAVLRHRGFALLFAGQAVSLLGDRIVMVAMPFAVLSVRGAGVRGVGIVLGATTLAVALFVLVGGVVGDRLPRRTTMLASDVVRMVAQGASAVLLLSDHASVPRLAVCGAVYGAAEAFFRPAALAVVPQLVSPEELQSANALLSLSASVSLVVGPAVAGVLVAVLGPGTALAVDALTFAVSALTLLFLHVPPLPVTVGGAFLIELAGGWREVSSRSWVWATLLAFSAYHALVLPALFVLGPLYAEQHRGGAGAWGIISAGFGVGAVAGSVAALHWRPSRPGLVIGGSLAVASAQALIGVAPLPTLVVAFLEAGTGVFVSLCFTLWETALGERVPAGAQSRVSSFDYLASLVLMPLGYVLIGPVAHAAGTVPTGITATIVTAAVCVAVTFSAGVRGLRPVASGQGDEVGQGV